MVVFTYALVAVVIGFAVGGPIGWRLGPKPNVLNVVSVGALVGFVLGALAVYAARGVALALRTQAQQTLCLLAIEANTQPRASA